MWDAGVAPAPDVVEAAAVVAPVEALPAVALPTAIAEQVCVIKKPTADTALGVRLENKYGTVNGELVVIEVVSGSITEASGLKVGNIIRSINGAPVYDPTVAIDALNAATGDITVTILPPCPPPISTAPAPVPAQPAALSRDPIEEKMRADPAAFRAAIEEKVRRLEQLSLTEATFYGETLTHEERDKAFPNGCYKCALVGYGCKTYMGGVKWQGSPNCVFCFWMCCLGIPITTMFPLASRIHDKNNWWFEAKGEHGQDNSTDLYLVDVENDTWAYYCCCREETPDCYCTPMFA